jgi:uncharacterized membrane protein
MSSPAINPVPPDPTCHPLAFDVNQAHLDSLTKTEKACKRVADWTGAPLALGLAVLIQAIWIPVGIFTKLDPYPFAFLLTCSNVLQLILIFVLAVGQRQSAEHAELRAEHDHDSISRLLYHQEVQEEVLIALARKIGVEVEKMEGMIQQLASEDKN